MPLRKVVGRQAPAKLMLGCRREYCATRTRPGNPIGRAGMVLAIASSCRRAPAPRRRASICTRRSKKHALRHDLITWTRNKSGNMWLACKLFLPASRRAAVFAYREHCTCTYAWRRLSPSNHHSMGRPLIRSSGLAPHRSIQKQNAAENKGHTSMSRRASWRWPLSSRVRRGLCFESACRQG